jgi:hypothetical protein
LLTKCIELLTQKKAINSKKMSKKGFPLLSENNLPILNKDEFFHSHMHYSAQLEQKLINGRFKILFIYRDPRDQIVSHAYWIIKKLNNPIFNKFKYPKSVSKIIDIIIKNIDRKYSKFMPWAKSKNVCTVRFENLIGPHGGGSLELQKKEIEKISNYVGVTSKKAKNNCLKNLFGGTSTFRKGGIGSWKKHFTEEHKQLFKKFGGKLLIELGYEKDLNW